VAQHEEGQVPVVFLYEIDKKFEIIDIIKEGLHMPPFSPGLPESPEIDGIYGYPASIKGVDNIGVSAGMLRKAMNDYKNRPGIVHQPALMKYLNSSFPWKGSRNMPVRTHGQLLSAA
jgi:hypothetical protein